MKKKHNSSKRLVMGIRATYHRLERMSKKTSNLKAQSEWIKAADYLKVAVVHIINGYIHIGP